MFAGDDETDGHHGLTDYELERVAHIRRNREIMRQLGLGDHDIVTAARARCGEKDVKSEPSGKRRRMEKQNAKRESETVEAGIERVLRRSRRLLNTPTVNAEGDQTTEGLPDEDDDEQYSSVDGYKKNTSQSTSPITKSTSATRKTRKRTRCATRGTKRASPWWARHRISTP